VAKQALHAVLLAQQEAAPTQAAADAIHESPDASALIRTSCRPASAQMPLATLTS
jgi:hypothetical protein